MKIHRFIFQMMVNDLNINGFSFKNRKKQQRKITRAVKKESIK